jgi:hypothetical protein
LGPAPAPPESSTNQHSIIDNQQRITNQRSRINN